MGQLEQLILAWDPDFTKVTPLEKMQLDRAEADMTAGDYVADSAINWN